MTKINKPLPAVAWLKPRLKFSRVLSLICILALIALLLIWNLLNPNPKVAIGLVLVFEFAALAIVMPGVLMGSPKGYIWACFVINLYFIKGVLACIDPGRLWLGVLEVLFSTGFFISGLLYTRWYYQLKRHAHRHNVTAS